MKHERSTARVTRYLLGVSLIAGAASLPADPAGECRQEVQQYAIPPEQAAEYIDGCILSRGGSLAPAAAEEYLPADESVPVDNAGAIPLVETEQMMETGQPDGELPGGVNGTY